MGFSLLMDVPQVLAYPTPEPDYVEEQDPSGTEPFMSANVEQSASKQARASVNDDIQSEDQLATPPFPKPLALSFRNFERYYKRYAYADGERMEVASRLVASFLSHYFPKPVFGFRMLPYGTDPLVETLKVEGTLYWRVETSTKDKKQDLQYIPPVLLVVVATELRFLQRSERTTPQALQFSIATLQKVCQAEAYQRGHVVILGGKTGPLRPTLEFYSFTTDGNKKQTLTPWFGKTTLYANDFGTNSFTLSSSEAVKIDQMFKRIEGCSTGDRPLNPHIELVRPTPKVDSSKPSSSVTSEPPTASNLSKDDEQVREYLRQLTMNKTGKVFESKTGRFLIKDKAEEAKGLAARLSITIAPPKGRKPAKPGAKSDPRR
jgi:hypothetical protein